VAGTSVGAPGQPKGINAGADRGRLPLITATGVFRRQPAKSPELHGKNGLVTLRLPLRATFAAIEPIRSRLRLAALCNCFCSAALTSTPRKAVPGVGRPPWLSPIAARSVVRAAFCSPH
jgi:hypothetical protein